MRPPLNYPLADGDTDWSPPWWEPLDYPSEAPQQTAHLPGKFQSNGRHHPSAQVCRKASFVLHARQAQAPPPPAEVGGDEESPVDAAVGTEEEALLQLLFACAAFPHHAQVRQTAATGDCRGEHSLRGPEQSPKEPEQFPRD